MMFGIKKIFKKKLIRDFTVLAVEMFGFNLFAVIVLNKSETIIYSKSEFCGDNSKLARKLMISDFKSIIERINKKDNSLFYK